MSNTFEIMTFNPDLKKIADIEDISSIYIIFLGRQVENMAVAWDQVGRPLDDTISGFIGSSEFSVLANKLIETGSLPHFHLSKEDYVKCSRWVAQITEMPTLEFSTSWWLVINLILRMNFAVSALKDAGLEEFGEFVSDMSKADSQQFHDLLPFLRIDADCLGHYDGKAALALSSQAHKDPASYYIEQGLKNGKQLLPAFSDGMDRISEKMAGQLNVSIQDILSEILSGAKLGLVSHWLFSASYYVDILHWRRESTGQPEVIFGSHQSPYLHFLSNDSKEVNNSPHPLFCYHAYDLLNRDKSFKFGKTFLDYVSDGYLSDKSTSSIFDVDFYLASNKEARYALLTGSHISALHHFITAGVFRDLPFSPDFDVNYYLHRYPDVRAAVASGGIPSASWHFVYMGLAEGKAPNPYFNAHYYRERHPHVPQEMQRLGIRSEIEHFLLVGKARGYKPERPLVTSTPAMDASKAVFQRRARRSFNNILKSGLDFSKHLSGEIKASIVVPVFNEVEFTSLFLECAYFAAAYFRQETGYSCEVIVVDNGSTDWTSRLLAACPGLKILSFDEPIGFPRAVNAGIAHSSGEIIIVSNNDIEFSPDVVLKVCKRLDAESAIGVLGGLTILPNETLQEAGSFLDSNAGVIGLGRYENPWDQYFQGVNSADYCTGSFISFRRADYDSIDGLDNSFSPGYYEETDFTFRMLEILNKHAAVDSDIQVTHFEHASFGKGRPPSTAYALIKKNQAYFASKHREALSTRPSSLELVSDQGARPIAIGRTRMLIIEDLMPDTRLGSGFVRSSQLLASLSRHEVAYDLLVLNPSPVVDEFSDPRVTVYRAWMPGEDAVTILATKASRYSHIMVCRTHNLSRFADQLEALRHQHGFRVICDTEALSVLRLLETKRLAGNVISDTDRVSAVRLELDAPVRVDQWIAVSPYERDLVTAAGFGPTAVICHHFDVSAPGKAKPWGERHRVLAVGAIHEAGSPNHDGLLWFMDTVYPRCADVFETLTLTMVGFWHPDIRKDVERRYADVRIDFVGVVSDAELAQLYAESRIALAPTRFAAGVASKVLEPMMLGIPTVMTDLLEAQMIGVHPTGPSGLAVASRIDDGESFADWISLLSNDPVAWEKVQSRQYDVATPLGGIGAFEEGIKDMLTRVGVKGANRHPFIS